MSNTSKESALKFLAVSLAIWFIFLVGVLLGMRTETQGFSLGATLYFCFFPLAISILGGVHARKAKDAESDH